ncbi:MAG: enoyl-CoA hydratase/isomerase family protein [Immundisolibacteraceae bacterium]|nr:enoyl-CoA hydratase/isomerase family protein [Immundisolibacteraceae bacterium]
MSESTVLYRREGKVAIITLNRPEAMNSMTVSMMENLTAAVKRFDNDDDAWVAIIDGNGRSFCTGADLKESLGLIEEDAGNLYELPKTGMATVTAIANCKKPTIAAIHGHTVAGGMLFANACALIVAAESTKIAMPETKVGMPTLGYLDMWKVVGPRRFMEMALTGSSINAQKALDWGLVNKVVADDSLFDEALAMANKIASNSPKSVAGHLKAVKLSIKYNKELLEEMATDIWDDVVYSEDLQEGLKSFGEKRAPVWKNK